ncbi:hypothetical protein M434DRAFT_146292 [Hypoxylon sp. CO27-5]|nr:hypothetical protein M434DRAFT_146292 [Hypoxylon sp. CO27-5]
MWTAILILVGVTTAWLVWTQWMSAPKLQMSHVTFEADNSYSRYMTEVETLIRRGYYQYTKHGLPFSLHNISDTKRPQVILPFKYLQEVKTAPQSQLSFPVFNERMLVLPAAAGPLQTDEATHMVKIDLNRALNSLIEPMQKQCIAAFEKSMPECAEWTSIQPYQVLLYVVASISARVLTGPEMCDNEKWIGLAIRAPMVILSASSNVKATYHPWFRWLAKYFNQPTKAARQLHQEAAELLRPCWEARLAALDSRAPGQRPQYEDGVQWLIEEYHGQGKELSLEQLCQDQLFLTIAFVHTTAVTSLSLMLDLIDHQESLVAIREEISGVQQENNGIWTRSALGSLWVMDSFMKESQRVHTLGQLTLRRVVVDGWTFKDGLHLPAGTQISFPSEQLNLDPEVHPNADSFDARRWLRKREQIDPNKFRFGSVTNDSINFGAGTHACPGRFFAQEELKLMLIHLVTNYEFKHVTEGTRRPPDIRHDVSNVPDTSMPLLFRRVVN